jgi:hypothetical protein
MACAKVQPSVFKGQRPVRGHNVKGKLDCIEAELGFCFTRCWPLRQNAVCQRKGASQTAIGRQLYNMICCSPEAREGEDWTAGRTTQRGATNCAYRPEIRMQKTGATSPSRSIGRMQKTGATSSYRSVEYLEEEESSDRSDAGSTRGTRQRAAKRGAHSGAREAYKTRMTAALDAELVRELFYLKLIL